MPTTSCPPPPAADFARLQALLAVANPAANTLPADGRAAATEALALAQTLHQGAQQAQAAVFLCSQLLRLGEHAEVMRLAPQLLPALETPELLAERCELLRVLTLCACEAAAFDLALDAAHEVVRLTAPRGEDGPALSAAFALAACFERMGDSWQAVRLLSRALDDHGGSAPDMPLLVATNGLCAISIGILHWLLGTDAHDEIDDVLRRARSAGERARSMLERVLNPAYEVAVLGNLGEVMLYQGELAEAEPLLRRSQQLARERGLGAHGWRVRVTLCNWLVAAGRPREGLDAVRALLAEMGGSGSQQTFLRAEHAAYRACRALGLHEEALTHFETYERTERKRATAQLRAQSQLFVTRTEAQQAQWQAEQARQDAQQERERAAEFAASAERDPLTGLGNRRHLQRRCAELLPTAQRETRPLALAQIDVDHFKAINDRHGHAAGDRVLVVMAQLLRENMRAGDVLARHGGEEFVLVLPGMGMDLAAEVCERLRERVAAHPWAALGGPTAGVTISIGLTVAPSYELATLLEQADAALYRAKRTGRNRLCVQT